MKPILLVATMLPLAGSSSVPGPDVACRAPRASELLAPGTTLFVDAINGKDSNDGTTASTAFETLNMARDVIRALPPAARMGGVQVNVAPGSYLPTGKAHPTDRDAVLSLEVQDSGTADAPILYVSSQTAGQPPARLLGGAEVPASAWAPSPTSAVPTRMAANLTAALGLSGTADFGGMKTGSLGDCAWDQAGVFIGGQRGVLARYPNIDANGTFGWTNIASVQNSSTKFTFSDDRIGAWASEPNVWLHGYWGMGWADNYVEVTNIDAAAKTVTTSPATPPLYGFKPKARFYGVNILAEADVPYEYYINQTTGMLFVVPPAADPKLATTPVVVALRQEIVSLSNVSFVTLSGLHVEYSRASGLTTSDISNVRVENCVFDNQGAHAVEWHGVNSSIHGCSITQIGCSAVSVGGGDMHTLLRGEMTVMNNTIGSYALWKRTYNAGVGFSGVGNYVTQNEIYNSPHTGLIGSGNDYLFEDNYVHDMCYEVTDSGAWYSGRSWAKRGNVIRGNTFERIQQNQPTFLGASSVQAVYFDDELSGQTCVNNTFIDCHAGIMLGGGRHVTIGNNSFTRVGTAVLFDNRGEGWQKDFCEPGGNVTAGPYMQELLSLNYREAPWSTHYPELLSLPNDHACQTCYNTISDNTYCKTKFLNVDDKTVKEWFSTATNNVEVSTC